ncbi:hypothetical protein DL93DRAFT_939681 [Clavulina sp. PMI_390]|nr:hypothetical protein DL93DRAFT_939681 [Clavulina sp. PMI_390]
MLRLLWWSESTLDAPAEWFLENEHVLALGWSQSDQSTALDILSPLINLPLGGLEGKDPHGTHPGGFLDAISLLQGLALQCGLKFDSQSVIISDFAQMLHPPSYLSEGRVISVAIYRHASLLQVPYSYAILTIEYDGRQVWASTRRKFSGFQTRDSITFHKFKERLEGPRDELLMKSIYQNLNFSLVIEALDHLDQRVSDTLHFAHPLNVGLDGWWYLMALLTALRPYRSGWETPPSLDWAQKAVITFKANLFLFSIGPFQQKVGSS